MTTLLDIQGRRTVGYLTNKCGGGVAYGDVVILDSSNNEAFTTSTAGAEVVGVGVVTEVNGIANNASGRVAFQGYVDLVNVNASVTRGHFGKTHTVAKQATDAGASRVLGVFCQFLTGGTTPTAMLFGQPDGVTGAGGLSGGTPGLTFSTTNAAGSAGSGIRTDATIALFDATAPAAIATAAAAGSAGVAARRDHAHTKPFVGCIAYHNTTQSVASGGSGAVLNLNSEDKDTGGFHDTSTNNSRITIVSGYAGLWRFTAYTFIDYNATGLRILGFQKNGTTRVGVEDRKPAQSTATSLGQLADMTIELAVNDYIEALVYQDSGSNRTYGDASSRWVMSSLVGEFLGA